MSLLHAVATDELPTVEGTPTECDDIVPDDAVTEHANFVTCPACLAIVAAKRAGQRAKKAISMGEQSGLYRGAAIQRPKGSGSHDR